MLGCRVSPATKWDRKNYFYPDLTKAYQISQLYAPLCLGGGLEAAGRHVRLNRIHLEEDAGKLVHERSVTKIDYNRAGVPLIEIVTEPDIRSPEEAVAFVERVRQTLVYGGVCDGKMEQGSLRVDANISLMPEGSDVLGTRAEIKNLNSFKFIKKALESEIERQTAALSEGGRVAQETRRFDEASGETFSMRLKEDSHDYRYFPDPDLTEIAISEEETEAIRASLPEPPAYRLKRYTLEHGLSEKDAETILGMRATADFYDSAVASGAPPKLAANAVKGEILRLMGESGNTALVPILMSSFIKALSLAEESKITQGGLKAAICQLFLTDKPLDEILRDERLLVSEDPGLIADVVRAALAADPGAAAKYKNGNAKILSYFFGKCMGQLKGKALPSSLRDELKKALDEQPC
jgi:aspartyl-tRNA(Asn)/glutamyl-tRNA(Gln) amidotransferase subunit B